MTLLKDANPVALGPAFSLLRHVRACQNAVLPGDRLPFLLGSVPVGWMNHDISKALCNFPAVRTRSGALSLDQPEMLRDIAVELANQGHYRCRGELFDVRATPKGPALSQIDRGALPSFGLLALGVHVNGLVRRSDGLHVWVGRRAADKRLDPGKLDHITAGGVAAGMTPQDTLIKEAQEEAGIPPKLCRNATFKGAIAYTMERPEGLRRDYLFCFDLELPEDFAPRPVDGEVVGFELWPVSKVVKTVRETDDFKFNVSLVLIDLFLRLDLIAAAEGRELRSALAAGEA